MACLMPTAALLVLILLFVLATIRSTALALVLLLAISIAYLATPPTYALTGAAAPPPRSALRPAAAPAPAAPIAPSSPQPASLPPQIDDAPDGDTPPRRAEMSKLPAIKQSQDPQSQWLQGQRQPTFRDKQRDAFQLHRTLRREGEWNDRWTEEDAKKYERMRRNVEYKIAKNLRPDSYMIVERSEKMSDTLKSDYPFASVHSENAVFHTSRFRSRLEGGSAQMISSLRSN